MFEDRDQPPVIMGMTASPCAPAAPVNPTIHTEHQRRRHAHSKRRGTQAYGAWDDALAAIDAERRKQMAAPGLQEPAKMALATLDREWDGLAAHRDYPMISLDNNAAERALRRPW